MLQYHPMNAQTLSTQKLIVVFLGILVVLSLGTVLYFTQSIVSLFMVAVFLAYLLDPLVRFLRRLHVPLAVAACIALLFASALLALLGTIFYTSVQTFVDEYVRYEPKIRSLIAASMVYLAHWEIVPPEWQIADLGKMITGASVASGMLSTLGSFVTFFGNLLLCLLFTIFILIGQQRLPGRIRRAFGEEQAERIIAILRSITTQVQTYLGAKALLSLVTGVLVNLVLSLFMVDFAELWGALALILHFVPNVGAALSTAPPVVIALLKFDTFMPALWVTVSLTMIHIVIGSLIEPRLMGQRLNLSPLVVILSLAFWGWLWGIVGMVLAVPIMTTIKIICENLPSLRLLSALLSSE